MKLDSLNSLSSCAFNAAYHEVLGEDGLPANGAIETTGPSAICDRLSKKFPPTCARGLAQQIGRSAFLHLVRSAAGMNRVTDQTFRLLPSIQHLAKGLEPLKKLVEDLFDIPVQIVDGRDMIRLETRECEQGHALIPHLEIGFIQEYIHWVCSNKVFPVSLRAQAPGWSIQIGKQPLES